MTDRRWVTSGIGEQAFTGLAEGLGVCVSSERDTLTRRQLLAAGLAGVAALAASGIVMGETTSLRERVDHLLLGVPDLDAGVTWLQERTGVTPQMGGSHPGMGTRNALVSLGGRQYLEIIAPDPAQSVFNFNIDLRKLSGPRLVTWAASTSDLNAAVASARHAGLEVFGPRDGSRVRPDGTRLRWRSAGIMAGFAEPEIDPVPFFIQWAAESRHPSTDAPQGCRLVEFEIAAPDPHKLEAALANLGIDAKVTKAAQTRLTATLETPKGRVNIY